MLSNPIAAIRNRVQDSRNDSTSKDNLLKPISETLSMRFQYGKETNTVSLHCSGEKNSIPFSILLHRTDTLFWDVSNNETE
jgi:hypothetical protein